jgi:hypothetical protein
MPDQPQSVENRLWRLEMRQSDVLIRLDKIEERISTIEQSRIQRIWMLEKMEADIAALDKRISRPHRTDGNGSGNGNGGSGSRWRPSEATLIRYLFLLVVMLIGFIVTGKFVGIEGLIKG